MVVCDCAGKRATVLTCFFFGGGGGCNYRCWGSLPYILKDSCIGITSHFIPHFASMTQSLSPPLKLIWVFIFYFIIFQFYPPPLNPMLPRYFTGYLHDVAVFSWRCTLHYVFESFRCKTWSRGGGICKHYFHTYIYIFPVLDGMRYRSDWPGFCLLEWCDLVLQKPPPGPCLLCCCVFLSQGWFSVS